MKFDELIKISLDEDMPDTDAVKSEILSGKQKKYTIAKAVGAVAAVLAVTVALGVHFVHNGIPTRNSTEPPVDAVLPIEGKLTFTTPTTGYAGDYAFPENSYRVSKTAEELDEHFGIRLFSEFRPDGFEVAGGDSDGAPGYSFLYNGAEIYYDINTLSFQSGNGTRLEIDASKIGWEIDYACIPDNLPDYSKADCKIGGVPVLFFVSPANEGDYSFDFYRAQFEIDDNHYEVDVYGGMEKSEFVRIVAEVISYCI